MHSWVRSVGTFAIAVLLFVAPDHAQAERVIDIATGKPIQDVYVVVLWSGGVAAIVESKVTCFSVDGAKTDSNGTFTLPPLSGNLNPLIADRRRLITLYKPGYKQLPMTDSNELPLEMEIDAQAGVLRMDYLVKLMQSLACGSEQQQKEVLLPIYKAIYTELKALAPEPTTSERALLFNALFQIEKFEIGFRQAQRNWVKRGKEAGLK